MTVRNEDVEYTFDDPDDGWFGMARPADAAAAGTVGEPPRGVDRGEEPRRDEDADDSADTDRWFVADIGLAAPVERHDTPRYGPSTWESRLSNSGAWDFKAKSGIAWYRSKAVLAAAAITAGVVTMVVAVLVLHNSAPGLEDPATVAPAESTTAPPAQSSSAPVLSPVAPLPPPPPPAEEIKPPVGTRQYTPHHQTLDETKKPQMNVTRDPISVAPPPPPQQTNEGHATPGQSGHHGLFGW